MTGSRNCLSASIAAAEPVDGDGTAVSFIQSLFGNFGSGIVAPGTGIVLQNRGSCFSISGGVEPGRVLDYLDKPNRKMCSLYLSLMDKAGVRLVRRARSRSKDEGLCVESGFPGNKIGRAHV